MSGAQSQKKRAITARELAERLGSSERTARRLVAEPRATFLARAADHRKQAAELWERGFKYREIAEAMGCSTGTVGKFLHDARKYGELKW